MSREQAPPPYRAMACGRIGVIKDQDARLLPPEAWTFADQVRFDGIDAIQEKAAKPLLRASEPVHLILGWNDGLKGRLLIATPSGIEEVTHLEHDPSKSQRIDRSPKTPGKFSPVPPNTWTGGTLGQIPYFCAGLGHTPWVLAANQQGVSNDLCEPLPHWPADHSCQVLRHFANHFLALNLQVKGSIDGAEATLRRPFDLLWSDRANPGALPKTWSPEDPGSRAGLIALTDGGDELVDGTTLGDQYCLYKEESLWRMQFVGGNYVFRFSEAITGMGIMGKNCAVDDLGKNYVFGRDEIFAHDGWQVERILNHRLNRWIFNRIPDNKRHLCHVFKRPTTREVYFCFPNGPVDHANMAAVYHTDQKTTTLKSFEHGGINTGTTFEFTNDETRGRRRPFVGHSLGIDELEVLSAQPSFRLEREGIDLGGRGHVEITRHIFLWATGRGSVQIELEGKTSDKSETKVIRYPLDTQHPGKPIEVSGRYHTLRLTNHDAEAFRLSGYSLTFTNQGAF